MALDRLGNTIATGQVYLLAGTVRRIDGDDVLAVVGLNGEHLVRVKAGDIIPATAKPTVAKLDVVGNANEKTLLVKAAAGQTAVPLEVLNSAAQMLAQITMAGAGIFAGGVQSGGTIAALSPSATSVNFWAFMFAGQTENPILVTTSAFAIVFAVAPSGNVTCGTVNSVNVAAHAARHRDGGADEVATTTAAAGAIPKANSDGFIPPEFIAAALEEGDLLRFQGGALVRIPIGPEGAKLTSVDGYPEWVEG